MNKIIYFYLFYFILFFFSSYKVRSNIDIYVYMKNEYWH